MSLPRQIVPGATYLLTRRTTQRQFLLRPAPLPNQIFEYCLAYAAAKYAIQVHGWCVLSNHYHLVVTDPEARLPAFMSWLNEFLAKTLNALHGRWENFFAPGSYSMVRLEDPEDVLDKMVYTLVNPVRAGLVARSKDWPGSSSRGARFGVSMPMRRPNHFFRDKGPMPACVELALVRPPGFEGDTDEAFRARLLARVEEREEEMREQARRERRPFLGRQAALQVQPEDSPATREPRRNRSPQVAALERERRLLALARLREFRAEYRRCWARWRQGDRAVVFPFGTYRMRLYAPVAAIPPPEPEVEALAC